MIFKFLSEIISGGFPSKSHVGSLGIIFFFPYPEKPDAMMNGYKAVDTIKFLIVRPMTPLDLSVLFRMTNFGLTVADPQIFKMPAEDL